MMGKPTPDLMVSKQVTLPTLKNTLDYEYSGEIRSAGQGEYYANGSGTIMKFTMPNPLVGIALPIVVPRRWRAEEGQMYWFVNFQHMLVDQEEESGDMLSDDHYENGNYYFCKEMAGFVFDNIKAALLIDHPTTTQVMDIAEKQRMTTEEINIKLSDYEEDWHSAYADRVGYKTQGNDKS